MYDLPFRMADTPRAPARINPAYASLDPDHLARLATTGDRQAAAEMERRRLAGRGSADRGTPFPAPRTHQPSALAGRHPERRQLAGRGRSGRKGPSGPQRTFSDALNDSLNMIKSAWEKGQQGPPDWYANLGRTAAGATQGTGDFLAGMVRPGPVGPAAGLPGRHPGLPAPPAPRPPMAASAAGPAAAMGFPAAAPGQPQQFPAPPRPKPPAPSPAALPATQATGPPGPAGGQPDPEQALAAVNDPAVHAAAAKGDNWSRNLLQFGLSLMAAGAQPGISTAGAIGQAGLSTLQSADFRKQRAEKKTAAAEETRYQRGQDRISNALKQEAINLDRIKIRSNEDIRRMLMEMKRSDTLIDREFKRLDTNVRILGLVDEIHHRYRKEREALPEQIFEPEELAVALKELRAREIAEIEPLRRMAGQRVPAEPASGPAPEQALAEARAAIGRGADPAAVRQRLVELGINPGQL